MKKLSMLLVLALTLSCSEDDNELKSQECKEVWGITNSNGEYSIEYGVDEDNTTVVDVDQSTFEYYSELSNDPSAKICWEGAK